MPGLAAWTKQEHRDTMPAMDHNKDNKQKLLTRNSKVWGVAGMMALNIAGYVNDPQAYDRSHPSPKGGAPAVVFLSTSASGYFVTEPGSTRAVEWNPAVSEAQYFAGLTPAEAREFALIRFPWEVEPDDTKT